jgi:hypothetical protein
MFSNRDTFRNHASQRIPSSHVTDHCQQLIPKICRQQNFPELQSCGQSPTKNIIWNAVEPDPVSLIICLRCSEESAI